MSKYTDLITNYHATKPKFFDHVDLSTRPLIDITGTTRGLELECKRYALRPIRFSWPEVLVSLLGVVFLAALLFLDQTRIGEIILWRV